MRRPLKTCPGEHGTGAPCAACAEDNRLCDLCWAHDPDGLDVRATAVPERTINVWDEFAGRSTAYTVCIEHYREHKRLADLELI